MRGSTPQSSRRRDTNTYARSINLLEQTKGSLEELNAALRSEDDAARARYVSVEPDYDYDDGWIVYVTWEIPAPNGEEWPLEVLDRYWQRTRDTVGDAGTAHCMFRTPDEMSEPGHQRGALLQPA